MLSQTPQSHIDSEISLLQHIQFCQQVFESEADWEYKYGRIFNIYRRYIQPLLNKMGVCLEWNSPDGSYEEDTTVFMKALIGQLLPSIEAVVKGDYQ